MVPVAAVCFGYDHDNINPPTVAPARGATDDTLVVDDIFTASIHAPARGATSLRDNLHQEAKASIHAPARGATKI